MASITNTRVATPFVSGTILNNPLAVGDVTLSSAALSSLPAIAAPSVSAIVLDPAGSAGAPEVVWVTAHTAAATTATITRGQESTVARQHLVGVPWVHGPTLYDLPRTRLVAYNTAEATTTSTSAADLLVLTVNIPVTSGIIIEGVARKTAGAANTAAIGLALNATVVTEAASAGSTVNCVWNASNANQAMSGIFRVEIMPRSTNYVNVPGNCLYSVDGGGPPNTFFGLIGASAAAPIATLTSITLRGIVGNAAVTLAVKEVAVYEVLYLPT